ncbi:MAG: hypothetical protein KC613_11410 [Myxococcales bacterium]|nr:hypothetical protein [Myxococcales bacterium]
MYGVLPTPGDVRSQTVSLVGFIRDVTTQLKRGLTGFWVAHPDFVRPGLALVEAWARHADGDSTDLRHLVSALVPDPAELVPLLDFVFGPDVPGLDPADPRYARSVLAADLATSPVIANDHPDEVRYNVFQALQYLTDWLQGNGCVALPAHLKAADGRDVFVRIMDDLATTERSRWELWAEVKHGRVSQSDFEQILTQELAFLAGTGPDHGTARRIQVPWDPKWSPVAGQLLHALVTARTPPEWVTELALPFTFPQVREAPDPWAAAEGFRGA